MAIVTTTNGRTAIQSHETFLSFVLGRRDARAYLAGRAAGRNHDDMRAHASSAFEVGYEDGLRHDRRFGAFLFREAMVIAGLGYVLKSISHGNEDFR